MVLILQVPSLPPGLLSSFSWGIQTSPGVSHIRGNVRHIREPPGPSPTSQPMSCLPVTACSIHIVKYGDCCPRTFLCAVISRLRIYCERKSQTIRTLHTLTGIHFSYQGLIKCSLNSPSVSGRFRSPSPDVWGFLQLALPAPPCLCSPWSAPLPLIEGEIWLPSLVTPKSPFQFKYCLGAVNEKLRSPGEGSLWGVCSLLHVSWLPTPQFPGQQMISAFLCRCFHLHLCLENSFLPNINFSRRCSI